MTFTKLIRLGSALLGIAMLAVALPAQAAMFVAGADPTTTFTNLLLDDVTSGGGFDTATQTSFNPARDLDIPTGQGDVDISITGIGLNFRSPTSTALETVTVTITYLGADGGTGGTDNVLLGSQSATLEFLGPVDEYSAVFDTPITGTIDGVEDRFLISISSTGNMRFKGFTAAQSPSGQNGLKVSVGGTATLVGAVPEPSTALLLGSLVLCACTNRRRFA